MEYPIIHLLKGDKNIYAEVKQNRRASIGLFSGFDDSIIIDSAGNYFKVESAYKTGWAYLWGYHPFFKGRTAKIDFKFKEQKVITLEELKDVVFKKLDNGVSSNFWYTSRDIPRLRKNISIADNYKKVIEVFLYDID